MCVDLMEEEPALPAEPFTYNSAAKPRRSAWRDCLAHLRQEIREGRVAPGSRLPSLKELEAEFDLTRFGARRVMDAIRSEGLAYSWHGRGSYVAERQIRYQVARITRFSSNVRRDGRSGRVDILDRGVRKTRDDFATLLDVAPGTRMPYALLLGYIDDRPAVLGRHTFAPDISDQILATLAHNEGNISQTLADFGFAAFHRHQTLFEARLPTRHEALTLDVPPSQPVMVTTALNVSSDDGRKLEVSRAVARADLVAFEVLASGG